MSVVYMDCEQLRSDQTVVHKHVVVVGGGGAAADADTARPMFVCSK